MSKRLKRSQRRAQPKRQGRLVTFITFDEASEFAPETLGHISSETEWMWGACPICNRVVNLKLHARLAHNLPAST